MKRTLLLFAGVFLICTLAFSQAVITIAFDGPLPGGLPKGVELYIPDDIADLSSLGIGSANNGGGSDSVEFSFPAVAVTGGTYIYVSSDSAGFADFFGFNPDYDLGGGGNAMAINGDDAIELFWDGTVIDILGEIDTDGTGTAWEYLDGWAARKPMTGPDGNVFDIQNWNFSGPNALDGEAINETATTPIPLQSYTDTMGVEPDATVIMENLQFVPADLTIEVGQTVRFRNIEENVQHNVNGSLNSYPCNPFGFFSGPATFGIYDYDLQFNLPGLYNYHCDPHLADGMVGTVTVVDPNAPDYPEYDIAALTTVDANGVADSLGVTATVEGIVHGPNFRPEGLTFVIIDDDGHGITVFKNGEDCYEVTEGDRVSVQGTIAQFNGLTQIEPDRVIEILAQGENLYPATLVAGPLTEEHESQLVAIGAIRTDAITATGSSGWNVEASGPLGSYLVRVDSDIFANADLFSNATFTVTGLGAQFDTSEPYTEGYQIMPRGPEDVEIISAVSDLLDADAIGMFPNPAETQVTFETAYQIENIAIYDYTGRCLLWYDSRKRSVNVGSLHPGLYLVEVQTSEGLWVAPLSKL